MLLGLFLPFASHVAGGHPAGFSAPAFGVAISDTPSAADPYLVEFNVTVASGYPTAYSWSFGDGQYSNGSGPGFSSPAHRYSGPGNYSVLVVVWEGSVQSQQTLPLAVAPAALRVSISAHQESGSLTETFQASVSGGSGVYPTVLWRFGDGGSGSGLVIQYTYQHSGRYVAILNITDSQGRSAGATTTVNPTRGDSPGPSAIASSPLLWAALGAIAVVGVLGTLGATRWATRRSLQRESIEEPEAPAGSRDLAEATVAFQSPTPPATLEPSPEVGTGASPEPPEALRGPGPDHPTPTVPHHEIRREVLRSSQRIVLHLAGLGTLTADEVAPIGFTQRGIATSLQVSQNALTNVLRRLVAGGVLVEDVRHVQGQPRRLKVYRLTPRGEAVARDLRRSRPVDGPVRPGDPPD